jgi:hypothetical protein
LERPWRHHWDHLPKRCAGFGFTDRDYESARIRAEEVARLTLGDDVWAHVKRRGYVELPSRRYPGVTYRLRVGRRIEVRCKPGVLQPTTYEVKGDMAESWEWSPDGLTLSMKLRQGAGWGPMAPVNGRPVTIEDVKFTWDRFGQMGQTFHIGLPDLDRRKLCSRHVDHVLHIHSDAACRRHDAINILRGETFWGCLNRRQSSPDGQRYPSGLPSCVKVTGAQQQSFAMQAHHDRLNLSVMPAKSTGAPV